MSQKFFLMAIESFRFRRQDNVREQFPVDFELKMKAYLLL